MKASIFFCLLLIVAQAFGETKARVQEPSTRSTADVIWDEFGVPHVFADSFEALTYGFGYAQARDHGRLVLELAFISSGRAAELGGFIFAGVDRLIYSLRLRQIGEQFYKLMDSESLTAFEFFAQGFNKFAEENPEAFDGPFSPILPLSGQDIFLANIRVLYTFTFAGSSDFILPFKQKYGEDPLKEQKLSQDNITYSVFEDLDYFRYMRVEKELREVIGSNGWAINSKSGKSDGKPKLAQNPHLPYYVFFRWYEAQLTCEACGIDVYGASLVGIPNLQIAFNDYLGWTHTVNPLQAYTGYVIDLASEDTYYYDGKIFEITKEEVSFKVKLPVGSRTETVINEFTIHGQIIARAANQVLVKRLGGVDDEPRPSAMKQWFDMSRAKNLDEFKDAMRQLQVPMFYTVVTTRDDDILLNFNGWIPKRKSNEDFAYWQQAVNGSISDTFWDSCHPWDELPTLENPESGFVQNANEPPWTATLPVFTLNPDNYAPYISRPASVSYRSQLSMRMMAENSNITFARLKELKHSTAKESASHVLDDLLRAVETYGTSELVFQAAAVLAAWDRQNDVDSKGADLYFEFMRASPETSSLYANLWDPEDPLNTPNTLANPSLAVTNLEKAATTLLERGLPLDSTYGDTHRLFLGGFDPLNTVPANGCTDCFRNSRFTPSDGGMSTGGDSWVSIVEWDANGAKGEGLIGYGNASPGSVGAERWGHVNDQNRMFSEKLLRPLWRRRGEVEEHVEEAVRLSV